MKTEFLAPMEVASFFANKIFQFYNSFSGKKDITDSGKKLQIKIKKNIEKEKD
jgi:hypothetical protein